MCYVCACVLVCLRVSVCVGVCMCCKHRGKDEPISKNRKLDPINSVRLCSVYFALVKMLAGPIQSKGLEQRSCEESSKSRDNQNCSVETEQNLDRKGRERKKLGRRGGTTITWTNGCLVPPRELLPKSA